MYCKSCGNNCNENAIACTSCGIPPKKGKSFCGDCGEKTNENAIICVKCGNSLSGKKIRVKKKKEKIDVLNNGKSFSTLKKFTIISILGSIVLLFMPWIGDINPINLVTFKNDMFDIIDVDDIPLTLNLFFYLGYITILFLVFSLFKIYKSDYRFASLLQFLNILALVLVIASNIFYTANGEYEDWLDDEVDERYSDEYLDTEFEECWDDYGIDTDKMERKMEEDKNPFKVIKFTPFLFIIIFLVNWILIGRLSRRKRLNAD